MIRKKKKDPSAAVYKGLIDKCNIDSRVLQVVAILQKKGFQAYVVGGALRDSLLGLSPKDFDVVTDATPNEVCKAFSNARVIGRRFKIVHIYFSDHYFIEVSTFRRNPMGKGWIGQSLDKTMSRLSNYVGLRKKEKRGDNDFGDSLYEDCCRRDLTINAMAYDPNKDELYDFFSGLEDLKTRTLKMIGEVSVRFTEDPVRILRVIRFASKLNFPIPAALEMEIFSKVSLLKKVNTSRLFEEFNKLFISVDAVETFSLLRKFNIHHLLFPLVAQWMDDHRAWQSRLIDGVVLSTVKRIKEERPVVPAFLFAVFLWPVLQERLFFKKKRHRITENYFNQVADSILEEQALSVSLILRDRQKVKNIWYFQVMIKQVINDLENITQWPLWRAGYNLYALRVESQDKYADTQFLDQMTPLYQEHTPIHFSAV